MKIDRPKVSVIMGIYNCEETLPDAISSILSQTYSNWELVMCDDGSTDQTYDVARSFQDRYPQKIVLLRNDRNRKLSYTLNRCLEAATGELIARMDGDDMCAGDRFEKQVSYLLEHPDIQLVGTGMRYFDASGFHRELIHPQPHPTKWTLKKYIPFFHATIMTYRSVYETLGGYTVDENVERVEDIDLWFRFYAEGFTGDNLGEALYYVREDESAVRRRTISGRYHEFLAFARGYRLLGFSRAGLVRHAVLLSAKALIPVPVMMFIRRMQKRTGRGA